MSPLLTAPFVTPFTTALASKPPIFFSTLVLLFLNKPSNKFASSSLLVWLWLALPVLSQSFKLLKALDQSFVVTCFQKLGAFTVKSPCWKATEAITVAALGSKSSNDFPVASFHFFLSFIIESFLANSFIIFCSLSLSVKGFLLT